MLKMLEGAEVQCDASPLCRPLRHPSSLTSIDSRISDMDPSWKIGTLYDDGAEFSVREYGG